MARHFSRQVITETAGLFSVLHKGLNNFSNELRKRMYFDSAFKSGQKHRPPMTAKPSLTSVPSMHLLASAIGHAALHGWINSNVSGNPELHFRNDQTSLAAVELANNLASLSYSGNLDQALSTIVNIQTSILTLPAGGPIGTLLNGESIGSAAIEQMVSYGVEGATDEFLRILRRRANG